MIINVDEVKHADYDLRIEVEVPRWFRAPRRIVAFRSVHQANWLGGVRQWITPNGALSADSEFLSAALSLWELERLEAKRAREIQELELSE